jgi:predicted GNAT superfamily acetyltransferase/predicted GIY-YIG superfamily endonuclease
MAGVIPDYRRQGIARRLKFAQRDAALNAGYDFIGWTYDPMRLANAVFNIEVLGACGGVLHPEFYGEMSDAVNRGLISDRFEVVWDLKDARVSELAAGERQPYDDPLPEFLLTSDGDIPQLSLPDELDARAYAIQLPGDLDGLRTRDPELTHQWYYALREAVAPLFAADYAVERVVLPPDGSFVYVVTGAAPWFLYIVEAADGSFYTGITTDVTRRIKEHNAGRGARYTRSRRPVTLLAAWRTFGQGKALKLEHHLKRQSRAQKLALVTSQSDFRGAKRIE